MEPLVVQQQSVSFPWGEIRYASLAFDGELWLPLGTGACEQDGLLARKLVRWCVCVL